MSNQLNMDADQPPVYQIRIEGHLGHQWTDWFDGMTVTLGAKGDTLLNGPLVDQAALHGLLKKVRDLGVPLLSINQVKAGQTNGRNGSKDDLLEIQQVYDGNHKEIKEMEEKINSIKKTAKIAGVLYFIYMAATIFADVSRTKLVVFGDARATANNILASEWLFRIGFMSDALAGVLFLLVAWALYVLLKQVNKNISLLFLLLNLGGVAVQCINMLNLFSAVLLLSGSDYLKVFQADQLQALAMLFLNLHKNGFMIAQLFYGAWLFPLGYLVFKSGYLPRILGIVLMVECFAWLIYPFQFFLFPSWGVISYLSFAVGFIGEFSLTLWLLIKGVHFEQLNRHIPEST